jgi:hypothetical protein
MSLFYMMATMSLHGKEMLSEGLEEAEGLFAPAALSFSG